MEYNFNENLDGFCENRKIKSIPLYLFNDIKSLNSTKIISEKQKKFLNTSIAQHTHQLGYFPDEQLSQKLPKRKWSVQFVDEFENYEKLNFILGWGLAFYNFSIKKINKSSHEKQSLCLSQCKKEISKTSLEKCFSEIRGIFLTRDLINLPPNILTPLNYEKIIKKLFKKFSPTILSYKDKQLEKNFPLVNFVG